MKHFFYPLVMIMTLLLASMLNVYPLSFAVSPYRPMILVLVLIFWAMYRPDYIGAGTAFLVGLAADLLLDTHLGYQAFCAVSMVFSIRVLTAYAKQLHFALAWVLASVSLTIYQLLLWLLQSFGQWDNAWAGWQSFLLSVLCFPLVWRVLFELERKFAPVNF